MDSQLNEINALNTRAVMHLQQNSTRDAISCSKSSLKVFVSAIGNTDCDTSISNSAQAFPASHMQVHHSPKCLGEDMDVEQAVATPIQTAAIPKMSNADSSVSADGAFAVFNRAFDVPQHDGTSSLESTPEYSTKLSATLLYNMALAWHHLGFAENNTAALKRALFVYEQAYRSLSKQSVDRFSHLLLLALANNMAHLHAHFFNCQQARSCRGIIAELLVSYRQIPTVADEYAFFMQEVLFFKCSGMVIAPAA